MKTYKKHDFPVDQVRRFLEPGPRWHVHASGRNVSMRRHVKPENL